VTLGEHVLHLVEEPLIGVIIESGSLKDGEFFKELSLLIRHLLWNVNIHADVLVTSALRATSENWNTFVLDAEDLA
jgi:hypothetical protein